MANHTATSDAAHGAATPIAAHERVFGFLDHAALWFSLGVGLLVMQVGAYLTPALGAPQAVLAIVAGSVLGAGLLAWVAWLGCRDGLSSAALIGAALGRSFAMLPVALNVLQLLGWTAFELVVMRDGSAALLHRFGWDAPWIALLATLLWGALLVALAAGSMVGMVRRFVSRNGLPLVVLSLAWLSWQFGLRLTGAGWSAWWSRPGSGGMSALQALDLVIAMPVSWLPLVADYARYGRSAGGALRGTWLGYTLANLWCYALGVLVVATAAPDADLVSTLLLAQGGLIALGLILVDEVDNAYGDVHSGAVSMHFLSGARIPIRRGGIALAALATGAALLLPMHSLEPFLLMLSSVFVPLFGVVISQLGFGGRPPSRAVRLGPALVWIAGIACFHLGARYWPQWGSALPSLALTLAAGALLRLWPDGGRGVAISG
jgi:NCS1 family nucleobase:cation symporter-1